MPEISLRGFKEIDKSELDIIKKLIANRLKKLNFNYQLLSIELKQHRHPTRIIHEIRADLFISKGKSIATKADDDNLYKAIDNVMKKLISEIKHKFKKQ